MHPPGHCSHEAAPKFRQPGTLGASAACPRGRRGQRSGARGEKLTPPPAIFSLKSQETGCFHRRPLQTQQLLGPSSLLLVSHLKSLLPAHIRLCLSCSRWPFLPGALPVQDPVLGQSGGSAIGRSKSPSLPLYLRTSPRKSRHQVLFFFFS